MNLNFEDAKEGSSEKESLRKCLDLPSSLNLFQATLEDLTPLVSDSKKHVTDLQNIKKSLEGLEEGPLKSNLLEKHNKILTNVEELDKELQALQTNRSFFKENGTLFLKITNIFGMWI